MADLEQDFAIPSLSLSPSLPVRDQGEVPGFGSKLAHGPEGFAEKQGREARG